MIAKANRLNRQQGNRPLKQELGDVASFKTHSKHLADESISMSDRITATVGRRPVIAIVTATAIGAVGGWLVKRHLA